MKTKQKVIMLYLNTVAALKCFLSQFKGKCEKYYSDARLFELYFGNIYSNRKVKT